MVGETVANAAPTWYIRGMSLLWSKNSAGVTSYLYNAHGDVVKTTGAAENDYLYDAFGNQVDEVSNQPFDWRVEVAPVVVDDNPFRYCGEYFDYETGYIYLRARYYDSSNGRFISEDPIRSGNHWYAYCGGNPIKFVDPMGLKFTPPGQDPKNPNHNDGSEDAKYGSYTPPAPTNGGNGGGGGTKPPTGGTVQPGIEVDRNGNPILPKPKTIGEKKIEAIEAKKPANVPRYWTADALTSPKFINDQSSQSDVAGTWGAKGSIKANGCGAIALYNALIAAGHKVMLKDVIQMLEGKKAPIWGGKLGTNPHKIIEVLNNYGTVEDATKDMTRRFDSVIVLYGYTYEDAKGNASLGAHYVAGISDGNGDYTFYNHYSSPYTESLSSFCQGVMNLVDTNNKPNHQIWMIIGFMG